MARPRKDGRAPQPAYRKGRERSTAAGVTFQVKAYKPTPKNPHGRVTWTDAETGKPTSRTPAVDESLDDLFEYIEAALGAGVILSDHGTLQDLGALYLDRLGTLGRDEAYIRNRSSLLTKWVYPVIGHLAIPDWMPEDSQTVLTQAAESGSIGPDRLSDLRSTLSGLRTEAHRRRRGGRLLSPSEDPLEGVQMPKRIGVQDRSDKYVPVRLRPTTSNVEAAIAAAAVVDTFTWMPDCIRIAGYNACRLGEQLALRAIDIDFEQRELDVNGSWAVQRKADRPGAPRLRRRKPCTKNRLRRTTQFVESHRLPLLALCRRALQLPEDATEAQVVAAITAERSRRAAAAGRPWNWRDYAEDPAREPWLFPDETGLPPTKERFNDEWHKVRDACGWDPAIPYKNLRHHAILRWKALLPDHKWEDLAPWSGHDWRTLQAYYVIPSQDSNQRARAVFDNL